MRLILASASPRRKDLLRQIGIVPDEIRPADVDESAGKGESPLAYCRRIAMDKALATEMGPDEIVLSADTTVALGRRIFGKPRDADEAASFLQSFSGRRHRVITAIVVRTAERCRSRHVAAIVRMKRLSGEEIALYIRTGEWEGKAGGYAIQGRAAAFIPWIRGSFGAIVGLPLAETAGLLGAAGCRPGPAP